MSDSLVKNKESEEVGSVVSSGSGDEASSEAEAAANEVANQETTLKAVDFDVTVDVSTLESGSLESSDDDTDFLDLLVDSLDGEFDPDLLI
mmetsp:Transcript_1148/g.2407  ORF Transcript_1148/g.2407 Transcript_1148/m.2407 type:complete len:91 (-) Transcript_1148:177-449(-)|eukprot:CAMPEP_0172297696 /NCGR_PEP_ID=MMETSP1058-20130122/618_1 /TAXON_ID=83371 /ORGANISM="Detonula confervacea, Strain CCMP 353" /LENGTH=90 /DNA_ID=CAMNT_0013006871 /DNA_START=959 /DNA_END=1231 /DNA_ORIENTATION=+